MILWHQVTSNTRCLSGWFTTQALLVIQDALGFYWEDQWLNNKTLKSHYPRQNVVIPIILQLYGKFGVISWKVEFE